MDDFQRKRFDNLLARAQQPEKSLIARELIARAFGWIDGLMEGGVIKPAEYSGLFNEIRHVEALIRDRTFTTVGLAS